MKIKDLQKNWDQLGRLDPLWAILTHSEKKNNKWDIKEFFKTGKQEINSVMEQIKSLGIRINHNNALDFGCGIGRLTHALADHFEQVFGVDIAPNMISLAKKYQKSKRECYLLNEKNSLPILKDNSLDFIYSNLTLQHIEPKDSIKYLKEFTRILTPGGVLIFQLPSKSLNKGLIKTLFPKKVLDSCLNWIFRLIGKPRMEMHTIDKDKILRLVKKEGMKIIEIKDSAGKDYIYTQYMLKK